ncbi:MAG: hypothetical protein JSS75_04505 [Bacteroidetes bacterium]|nr:hypothetical protein [Bacteroidota bacterium]
MSTQVTAMERRIRKAAIIMLIALVGTLASLMSNHPLAFVEFAVVGLLLIVIGTIYYLISLVRGEPRRVEQV